MMQYYSLEMKLDDVVKDGGTELTILENIRRCSKIVGKSFKVIFWHENLSEQDCKDFIERNEHLLFEVTTKITKIFEPVWFLIRSEGDRSSWRYKSDGAILDGIASYLKIVKHMNNINGSNNG